MLAEMKAEYSRALPEKLAQIESLWGAIVAGAWSAAGRAELVRGAHTIAGSAKTFGLPAVSEAARSLGEAVEQLDVNSAAESNDLRRIAGLIDALRMAAMPPEGR